MLSVISLLGDSVVVATVVVAVVSSLRITVKYVLFYVCLLGTHSAASGNVMPKNACDRHSVYISIPVPRM